ncbi:amyloid beta precursor protein binding family B member 1-like [Rhinoraja longicauda]
MGCLRTCLCGGDWSLLSAAGLWAEARGRRGRDAVERRGRDAAECWGTGEQSDGGVVLGAMANQGEVVKVNGCVTPSLTLDLRSSHNELLNADLKRCGAPKGRTAYASTDLPAAMGLATDTGSCKWVKDGRNQLRRAAQHVQQDQNRNVTGPEVEPEAQAKGPADSQPGNTGSTGGFLQYYMGLELSLEGETETQNTPLLLHHHPGDSAGGEGEGDEGVDEVGDEGGLEVPTQAPPDDRKASCLFFGMRNTAPSDEDSSWASLSQGSASWSSPDDLDGVWQREPLERDADLPAGWMRVRDTSGTYYWHIPTGTTQWQPPPPPGELDPRNPPATSPGITPSEEQQLTWAGFTVGDGCDDAGVWKDAGTPPESTDNSLRDFEGATLRYASLSLGGSAEDDGTKTFSNDDDETKQCFQVQSLGWVEMLEDDLAPGKSSVAVNTCIRQLSMHRGTLHDSAGSWGQGKTMQLLLEDDTLTLVDPVTQTPLHMQPIVSIRVWGVGRDNGRDFAYVARDKLTRVLKCHVFRCDSPAKAIATRLHHICSQIMADRKETKSSMNGLLFDHSKLVDVPFQASHRFPSPDLPSRPQPASPVH